MPAPSLRRCLCLVVLAALVVAPGAAFGQPFDLGLLLARMHGALAAFWAPSSSAPGGLADHGCEIVPDGRFTAAPASQKPAPPPKADNGCEIMPDGRCGS